MVCNFLMAGCSRFAFLLEGGWWLCPTHIPANLAIAHAAGQWEGVAMHKSTAARTKRTYNE